MLDLSQHRIAKRHVIRILFQSSQHLSAKCNVSTTPPLLLLLLPAKCSAIAHKPHKATPRCSVQHASPPRAARCRTHATQVRHAAACSTRRRHVLHAVAHKPHKSTPRFRVQHVEATRAVRCSAQHVAVTRRNESPLSRRNERCNTHLLALDQLKSSAPCLVPADWR